MAHVILHKNGAYNVYMTIAGGPGYETALTLEQLEAEIVADHGNVGLRELPERLARAHATGCSAPGLTLERVLVDNVAGPNETPMSFADFVEAYLTLPPVDKSINSGEVAPSLASACSVEDTEPVGRRGTPPEVTPELADPLNWIPDNTLKYWIEAHSDPMCSPDFTGHAMLLQAAKEYQAFRKLIDMRSVLAVISERNRQSAYPLPNPEDYAEPKLIREDLVRACASILVEIERLDKLIINSNFRTELPESNSRRIG